MPVTVQDLLAQARQRLAQVLFRPSTREATLLLGHVLSLSEAQVLAHPEREVPPDRLHRYQELLERRLRGEPVAYLVGEREFYGRPFHVDPRVLIPRPETEHLVEAVLEQSLPKNPRILDLGTGCGCLAVTLALEIPGAKLVATDVSPAALAVAAANARRHGVADRVALLATDLAVGLLLAGIDLVVSNPPYVSPEDAHRLSVEVREFEPKVALFAPGAADAILRRLLHELAGLRPGTPLLLEIGQGQLQRVKALAEESPFHLVEARRDYAGIPRVVIGKRRRGEPDRR